MTALISPRFFAEKAVTAYRRNLSAMAKRGEIAEFTRREAVGVERLDSDIPNLL